MMAQLQSAELDLVDLVTFMREGLADALMELEKIQGWDRLVDDKIDKVQTEQTRLNSETVSEILQLKREISSVVTSVNQFRRQQSEMGEKVEYLLKSQSENIRGQRFSPPFTPVRRCQSFDCFTLGIQRGSDRDSGIVAVSDRIKNRIAANFTTENETDSDRQLVKSANRSLMFCQSLQRDCLTAMSNGENSDEEGGGQLFTTSEDGEAERVDFSLLSKGNGYFPSNSTRIIDSEVACQVTHDFFEISDHSISCQTGDSLVLNNNRPQIRCSQVHNGFHRHQIVKELLDTERTYCSILWSIQEDFVKPLCDSELISAKDLSAMFPDQLLRIYELHCVFLHKVESKLNNWIDEETTVGDVFLQFITPEASNLTSLYYDFVTVFPRVTKMLKKHFGKSSKLKKLLTQRKPNERFNPPLMLVLTPVQRIPRYALLLKELLRNTCEDHSDHSLLTSAGDKLHWLLDRLNENMEQSFEVCSSPGPETTKISTPLLPANHSAMKFGDHIESIPSILVEGNTSDERHLVYTPRTQKVSTGNENVFEENNPTTSATFITRKNRFGSEPSLHADGYEKIPTDDYLALTASTPNRASSNSVSVPQSKSIGDLSSTEKVSLPSKRRKPKNLVTKNLSAVKSFFLGSAKKPDRLHSDASDKSHFISHLVSPMDFGTGSGAKRSSSATTSYGFDMGCANSPVFSPSYKNPFDTAVNNNKLEPNNNHIVSPVKRSPDRSLGSKDFNPDTIAPPPLPPRLQTPFRPRILKATGSGGSGGKAITPMKVLQTNWSSVDSADEKVSLCSSLNGSLSGTIKITSVEQLDEEFIV